MVETVTATLVRNQLGGITADMLSDTIIDQIIGIAAIQVDEIKRDSITAAKRDAAVTLLSAYHSYLAYTAKYVGRAQGRVPMAVEIEGRRLKEVADTFIATVISGVVRRRPVATAGKRHTYNYFDEWTD